MLIVDVFVSFNPRVVFLVLWNYIISVRALHHIEVGSWLFLGKVGVGIGVTDELSDSTLVPCESYNTCCMARGL